MWFLSFDAETILWSDFFEDVHMTYDKVVYDVRDCLLPAAAFKIEYLVRAVVSLFGGHAKRLNHE